LIVTFSPLVMRRRIADNIIATNELNFFSFSYYYYSHYLKISSFYSSFSRLRCRSGPMGPAGGQTRPQKGGLYFPRRSNLVFHFLFPSSFETYNSVHAAVGEPEANLLCIYAYKCVCVCCVCVPPSFRKCHPAVDFSCSFYCLYDCVWNGISLYCVLCLEHCTAARCSIERGR
jgi:hypothetical protein